MFQNFSQTYASQITAAVGFIIVGTRAVGWDISEGDLVFAIGALMNFGGIIWALYHRFSRGDVTVGGLRK
jgi:hypothetical protein